MKTITFKAQVRTPYDSYILNRLYTYCQRMNLSLQQFVFNGVGIFQVSGRPQQLIELEEHLEHMKKKTK